MGSSVRISWWALAIRGVAGILLGIAAFAWTGIALLVLIALFAAYLLVDGVFAIVAGIRGGSWLLTLEGALGIVVGIIALVRPGIAAVTLVYLVAVWAILSGLVELGAAYRLRRIVPNEFFLVLGGIVSIVFGILLAVNPSAGVVTIVWLFGAYMLLFGVLALALALRLRSSGAARVIGPV